MRVSIATLDESNRILRQFKSFLPNFVRIGFVKEDFERNFYFQNNSNVNFLLGNIHKTISQGFNIGSLHFDFLGYSNS